MSAAKTGAKKGGQNVPTWLDDETVGHIDRLAQKIGITRSKMVANLVAVGMDDALLLEKSGILPVMVALRKWREARKERGEPDPEAVKKALR